MNSPSELQLYPVSTSERINSLDIIRGIALLGILLMNIVGFGKKLWLQLGKWRYQITWCTLSSVIPCLWALEQFVIHEKTTVSIVN